MSTPSDELPPPRQHILKSLQFIMNNSDFATLPHDQVKLIGTAYFGLKGAPDQEWTAMIPQLEIPILNDKLTKHSPCMLIGGTIGGQESQTTFSSLSVCILFASSADNEEDYEDQPTSDSLLNVPSCCLNVCGETRRIVRRFHFDFQPGGKVRPLSHIQYGGKFPKDERFGDCHYCLEHFLENPRFQFPQMDLVLLLDMIIREFQTPLEKWKEEKDWKGLVLVSQALCYRDYWNIMAGYLNNPNGRTLHERIYGDEDEF